MINTVGSVPVRSADNSSKFTVVIGISVVCSSVDGRGVVGGGGGSAAKFEIKFKIINYNCLLLAKSHKLIGYANIALLEPNLNKSY